MPFKKRRKTQLFHIKIQTKVYYSSLVVIVNPIGVCPFTDNTMQKGPQKKKKIVNSQLGSALTLIIIIGLAFCGKQAIHILKTHSFLSWQWLTALVLLVLAAYYLPKKETSVTIVKILRGLENSEKSLVCMLRYPFKNKK